MISIKTRQVGHKNMSPYQIILLFAHTRQYGVYQQMYSPINVRNLLIEPLLEFHTNENGLISGESVRAKELE